MKDEVISTDFFKEEIKFCFEKCAQVATKLKTYDGEISIKPQGGLTWPLNGDRLLYIKSPIRFKENEEKMNE